MKINLSIVLVLLILLGCQNAKNIQYSGFWEGPHPEDLEKKFYIHLLTKSDSISAEGYWTHNNYYDSRFDVDSVTLNTDHIRFYIPDWECYYSGRITDQNSIEGGFDCTDEPFDSVKLVKNDEIKTFLTEAKPGCLDPGYQYDYQVPVNPEDGLEVSPFQSVGDSMFIYSLIPEIINNEYGRLNSFLLVKNGKLICEEYFYGYTPNKLHQIESSTKSITSLLIGIAKDKGMIKNLDEPLYQIFPSYPHLKSEGYNKITINHLLTMTSGFSPEYEPYQPYDRIEFLLNRKLIAEPGEKFIYDGGNPEILGAILKIKTGMFADEFAEKYLFSPLKITNYDWSIFKQNGYPCMGGSLQMLPRDMAKTGMLVLNSGVFEGQPIISEKWVKESTSVKTKTHIEGDDYSYLWWNINLGSEQNSYKTIWANGWGSQFIYIIPDLDIVMVTTGANYEYDSWAITSGISKYLYLLNDK
ncbi:MAG TPA: serine hydrolase [Draconibacterium sp.]|nr:serine hydrolase [Draconibacterium sp.]